VADQKESNARYTQFSPAGQYVPEAVEQVIASVWPVGATQFASLGP
jgi:hypothetical protein